MARNTLNIADSLTPMHTALDLDLGKKPEKTACFCIQWFWRSCVTLIFDCFDCFQDSWKCSWENCHFLCTICLYIMTENKICDHFRSISYILENDPSKWPTLTWPSSEEIRSRSKKLGWIWSLTQELSTHKISLRSENILGRRIIIITRCHRDRCIDPKHSP